MGAKAEGRQEISPGKGRVFLRPQVWVNNQINNASAEGAKDNLACSFALSALGFNWFIYPGLRAQKNAPFVWANFLTAFGLCSHGKKLPLGF
jgi:hypothetical protein